MKLRLLILGLGSLIGVFFITRFYIYPPIHVRQIILLGLYISLQFGLAWRHRHLKISFARILSALVLGFAWLFSTKNVSLSSLSLSHVIIFILAGLVLSFTFYLIIEELRKPFSKPIQKVSAGWMLLYAIIPITGWIPYFLAYYPAKMSKDSLWQWAQAHRVMPFNDWHPILDTWIIQATTLVHNSPSTYIILQVLVMAFVVSYGLYTFQKQGMPIWLVSIIDIFYAVNPVNGFFAITIWKDILFAAFLLLLTLLLMKNVWDPNWLKKRSHAFAFVVVSFVVMNLRSNAVGAVLISLLLVIVMLKEIRRRLLLLLIPILILQVLFIGPIMGYFHVIKPPLNEALAIPSQQIAAAYKYQGKFTPQLRAYFDEILPAKNWRNDYTPYTVNPIKFDKQYNSKVIETNFPKYLANWAHLLELNPNIFVRAYMKQVAAVWQFSTPKNELPYLDTPDPPGQNALYDQIRVQENSRNVTYSKVVKGSYLSYSNALKSYGKSVPTYSVYQTRIKQTVKPLDAKPLSSKLTPILNRIFNHTRMNWKNYFVKGAIGLFLLLTGLVASLRRYRWRGLSVFLPALFVIITMGMAMPATDFRYSYGFVFSVPFLLFFSKLRTEE